MKIGRVNSVLIGVYKFYVRTIQFDLDASRYKSFDFSLTVHLSITLANDQLDAQIFNAFITNLYMYMFGAISCSSSGGHIVLTFWHRSFTFKF